MLSFGPTSGRQSTIFRTLLHHHELLYHHPYLITMQLQTIHRFSFAILILFFTVFPITAFRPPAIEDSAVPVAQQPSLNLSCVIHRTMVHFADVLQEAGRDTFSGNVLIQETVDYLSLLEDIFFNGWGERFLAHVEEHYKQIEKIISNNILRDPEISPSRLVPSLTLFRDLRKHMKDLGDLKNLPTDIATRYNLARTLLADPRLEQAFYLVLAKRPSAFSIDLQSCKTAQGKGQLVAATIYQRKIATLGAILERVRADEAPLLRHLEGFKAAVKALERAKHTTDTSWHATHVYNNGSRTSPSADRMEDKIAELMSIFEIPPPPFLTLVRKVFDWRTPWGLAILGVLLLHLVYVFRRRQA